MTMRLLHKNGSVLILAIWTLTFLAVFASYIGLRIRQRASVLARIEAHAQLRQIAKSGIYKAISVIRADFQKNTDQFNTDRKISLYNNPALFASQKLGRGSFELNHSYKIGDSFMWLNGVEDEESKININLSDWIVIKRLMKEVLNCKEEDATALADAIIDWREIGQVQLTGFYSDDYYDNLPSPYKPKDAEFEVLDELKLLKGVTEEIYDQLIPYLTIYGDGSVNINTASREVLMALGIDDVLADKVLEVRRGQDGIEFTADDFIFKKHFDVASDVNRVINLTKEEISTLDNLNALSLLKTNSFFYHITSKALLSGQEQVMTVDVIYNTIENKNEYFREK